MAWQEYFPNVSRADWEAFVRQAAPLSDDGESDEGHDLLPLAPTNLPAPATLPARSLDTFYSPYCICSGGSGTSGSGTSGGGSTASKLKVPRFMVVRDHTETACRPVPAWFPNDVPHPADVVVLKARDAHGNLQYGWYARRRSDPLRLARLSYEAADSLWAVIRKDPELKSSSLNVQYVDCYFSNILLDFDALLTVRLESARRRYNRLLPKNKKRRRDAMRADAAEAEGSDTQHQRSKPVSPSHTSCNGQCTVCLEEDIEVHLPTCCGATAATCADCRLQLRNICPVCERTKLNAAYQCLTCSSVVTLREYGLPCTSCHRCTLCVTCYKHLEECVECDAVRCARV